MSDLGTNRGVDAVVRGKKSNYPLGADAVIRRRYATLCLSVILPLVLIFASPIFAQENSARISGIVTDQQKAIVRGAKVDLINLDTGVHYPTISNSDGVYVVSAPIGNYRLQVDHVGFKTVIAANIVLHTEDAREINFELAVGSASESVTVNAGATNDSPAVSLTVTRDFIEDMPLNGRSVSDLIALTPGASEAGGNGVYSINGQRADSNNFTVDGVSANTGGENTNLGQVTASGIAGSNPSETALGTTQSLVGLDALEEFKIQTSGYTAEYGRNPGGQVEFTTRSGTDTLHGSLFEYLRNTVLDANTWSNNTSNPPLPRGKERQNDFGGTLGGPFEIPHYYDGKDKTFYFVSYEGLRLQLPSSGNYIGIPSDAFRAWASPNVQPFLDAMPDPAKSPGYKPIADGCTVPTSTVGETSECDGTIPYSYSSKDNLDAMSFRVDHALSSGWKFFVRYADTPSDKVGNSTYNPTVFSNGSHLWTVGATANLSRNILSDSRFNFTHETESNTDTLVAYQGSVPWSPSLAVSSQYLTNPYSNPDVYVQPAGTSLGAGGEYGGSGTVQRQYEIVQSLSWTHEAHTFKFGVDWRHLLVQNLQQPYSSFVYVLSLSDVQQGNATDLSVSANAVSYPVFNNLSLYAQDHWKLGTKLTLDYGLRWEFNPPPSVSQGYSPLAIDQVNNLSTTQFLPYGSSLYHSDYLSFAPRLGFAYRLNSSPGHPLVLRGGGGLFYDTGQQVAVEDFLSGYPYTASGATQTEVPLPLSQAELAAPTVSLMPPYGNVTFFTSPKLTLPYTEQWNLSLDRTMNEHNVLTLSYVGNAGHKLLDFTLYRSASGNLNPAVFSAGSAYINENGANSAYNALQVMDTGNITRNLQMVGSYTWSHALDDLSQNGSYYSLERGNSNYDLRQMLNVALNYRLQLEKGSFLSSLRSGWLLTTRFVAEGGLPIDLYQIRTYTAINNNTDTEYRPNLVPGQPIYLHGSAAGAVPRHWLLNRAAFACTSTTLPSGACSGVPTVQGTLGRNYVRNPPVNNFNLSAERSFPIYDRLNLNFRVDAFNVFNHVNVSDPVTYTFADSQFGVLSAQYSFGSSNALYQTGANRSLQLNLHLQF